MVASLSIETPDSAWGSILESEGIPVTPWQEGWNEHGIRIADSTASAERVAQKIAATGGVLLLKESAYAALKERSDECQEETLWAWRDFSNLAAGGEDSLSAQRVTMRWARIGQGWLLCYDDRLDALWSDSSQKVQEFALDDEGRIRTHETLCRIVKGNVRRYCRSLLKKGAALLEQPLLYLWKFPNAARSVFNLRIDVDPERSAPEAAVRDRIERTFAQAEPWRDRVTFVINYYRRLPDYHRFSRWLESDFDIQSHNFFHCLYPFASLNRRNMELAHRLLKRSGIAAKGFVAPEYFWYPHTADVIESLGYSYSHSFGFDYNNYPYRPLLEGRLRRYLEMPVDPFVYSKFKAAVGEDREALSGCYRRAVQATLARVGEPCLKCEHPQVLGDHPWVMETLMSSADEEGVMPVTLTGWAEWCERRRSLAPQLSFSYQEGRVAVEGGEDLSQADSDLSLALEWPDEEGVRVVPLKKAMEQGVERGEGVLHSPREQGGLFGETLYHREEERVGFLRTRKHRRKIIHNMALYFRYRMNGFYFDAESGVVGD